MKSFNSFFINNFIIIYIISRTIYIMFLINVFDVFNYLILLFEMLRDFYFFFVSINIFFHFFFFYFIISNFWLNLLDISSINSCNKAKLVWKAFLFSKRFKFNLLLFQYYEYFLLIIYFLKKLKNIFIYKLLLISFLLYLLLDILLF